MIKISKIPPCLSTQALSLSLAVSLPPLPPLMLSWATAAKVTFQIAGIRQSSSISSRDPKMKRRRRSASPVSISKPPHPSTPPTPQTLRKTLKPKTASISSRKPRIVLEQRLTTTPTTEASSDPLKTLGWEWVPLNIGKSELCLPLTFPTGQTFRWKQTGPAQYTGVVKSHLVSLKQLEDGDVAYFFHRTADEDDARSALLDFLNAGISLTELWRSFSDADPRFAELAQHLGGARVLRQDPFECLIQFLCSSNNNIKRITKMVDHISSLGEYLGTVEGFQFHEFPSLERLSSVSQDELREAGFGYRAKYITGTIDALRSKRCGGAEWLASLRYLDLQEATDALSTLPGVGPKVAACIALFSLDQHHAIPVDTHVWQIATRYIIPELAGARLTPKLCNRVANAVVTKYGKYAGWAQTLLFIAELPSSKVLLPSIPTLSKGRKSAKQNGGKMLPPGGADLPTGIVEKPLHERPWRMPTV